MINVLFVCLGNICRSPMAEGVFKARVQALGKEKEWGFDSAGTSRWHLDEPPDARTLQTLRNNGIELDHLGRQVLPGDATHFEYILAMDRANYEDLKRILPANYSGLYMMRHFDPVDRDSDVPDPYYGGQDQFNEVYTIVDRAMDEFVELLKSNHG